MQKIGDIPNTRADNNGEFTDGNVAGGVPPTILPAEWFNTIQRELMSILNAAEIESDPHVFNQVLLSIQKLVSEGIPDLKDASLTQKGVVQLSNATNSNSQILAATPKAVSDLGALLLKITNNLSEIKDAGPAAVAQTLLNLGLGEGSLVPIGIPLPYPLATPPTGFLKVNGSSFSAATYPKLALAYPSGVLPDLRGEFIRGFDDGRGVRADQNLLGWQGGGIQSHNHGLSNFEIRGLTGGPTPGWFTSVNGLSTSDSGGDETRPRNIAFNYIVRAL
ncbi:putative bacteriophage tail fiber protein [Yersinia enterocolitica subsp. enterocolitica WA-314]|uniref:phage tail protein n=1 Tax=Yersinia enterocolitica TaxID=630 RepID=UPI00028193B5|nr:phage tail protein [Yersinia enterocolitica]AJI81928.1 phage tail fiber repeat family protein [Yersinia enterocolitica]EKA26109.1 putative bacteriophage tail fiber protein [Yersinia enterocolitica subsp. enterocolitica WA-314]KGA69208.1 phage tail fiber repeat family protein [Yersinia enterocolitica]CNK11452.1 putative bacteriophage tail fiber protein [Yersinia enterocolitica]VFS95284.1 putative side tail fiber protein from lambdoid prophage [Yersinia enterocolitica]